MGTKRRNLQYFPRMKFRARNRNRRQSKWVVRIWDQDWQLLGTLDSKTKVWVRPARPPNEEVGDSWACETP